MTETGTISNKVKYSIYLLIVVVLYFVFFHRLGTYPIRTWDESVYAVYSYEMMQNGNYIVPHIDGQLDYANDKPPLFFWSQIAAIKLFGYNEFSIRFPSALFGALTVLILFLFLAKRYSFYFGLSVALVLTCTMGFVTFHSARTGDMDTMLAFGLTGSTLNLIAYLQNQKSKYLIWYFAFVVFSFFTKSVAGFFLLPAHAVIVFVKQRSLFKNVKLWLGLGSVIGFVMLYVVIRSKYEPGYFNSHFSTYLGKFQTHFNESHNKNWDFYINNLFNERYSNFILFVIPALIFSWFEKSPELKQLIFVTSVSALFYFLVILVSPTKCYWYDVPLFPLLAVLTGYFIWKVMVLIAEQVALTDTRSLSVLIIAIFIPAMYFAMKRSYNNQIPQQERRIEVLHDFFMTNMGKLPYEKMKVVNDNYITPLLFYKYMLKERNKELSICIENDFQSGDVVITGNDSVKTAIQNKYGTEILQNYKQAIVYKIKW